MYPRLVRVDWLTPKQALPITPVRKCGPIFLIMASAIFGRWDVCFTKWLRFALPLWPMISARSRKGSLLAILTEFLATTHKTSRILSGFA